MLYAIIFYMCCGYIDLTTDDVCSLILAWKGEAEIACCFSRKEFIKIFESYKVYTLEGLKSKIPTMRKEILDPKDFKEFYQFLYQ